MDELYCLSKGPEPTWITAPAFKSLLSTIQPDYPAAIWRGSPNYWTERNEQDVVAICDHIMQSSIESADSWFKNTAAQVSAHFGVAQNGRVWQWVKVENAAWANGITNKSDVGVDWLQQALKQGINPNLLTVSIEHEGYSGQAMPERQFQSTLKLHKWLIAQFNIPIDREHIIAHAQIDSVNRPNCPGPTFPFARLIAELGGKVTSQPAFDPNPKGFRVGAGMLAKLIELQLIAETNEQYYYPGPNQPGLGQKSELWTNMPGLKLEAYQELDNNNNPTGLWDIRALKDIT